MAGKTLDRRDLLRAVEEYVRQDDFQQRLQINSTPQVSFLAQGEYNINFLIEAEEKFVLRLNTASQMNLDNQIKYEYNALENLKESTVTPKPLLLDDSCEKLPLGMLVMEYLPGRSLKYQEDLSKAARVLAAIHEVKVKSKNNLIVERNPFTGIWEECSNLIPVYLNSSLGRVEIKRFLEKLLLNLEELKQTEAEIMKLLPLSIVNTEVNSGNFIIDEDNDNYYLVDWEKPLVTTPLQDLSHFMVPTTTLWKTNYQLKQSDCDYFTKIYRQSRNLSLQKVNEINEALEIFDKFSALRGISWSAMAWIEYQQPGKVLKNNETFDKVDMYLKEGFLKNLFPEIE